MTDYVTKTKSIRSNNFYREIGKDYDLGTCKRIEWEDKRTYLVYYDYEIERIHNVNIEIMTHESERRMIY